jgi:NodT family efflux transporter outer membrane factor (OMF) lipoprotein
MPETTYMKNKKYHPSKRRHRTALPAIAAALLLGGCAQFSDITPSGKPIEQVSLTVPAGLAQTRDAWPQDNWWQAWGDPQLNRLIEHALNASPNLATARSRIARAQSAAGLVRGGALPQVDAALSASYGRLSENYQVPKPPLGKGGEYVSQGLIALNFGYELDLWGKNAALIGAAEHQVKAAVFDHDAARLALTTSIARAYSQLAAQYELQDILAATAKQRHAIRELTAMRIAKGLDTNLELRQNETSEAALRMEQAQLDATMEVTRLQLSALAGDMPDAAKSIARPAPSARTLTVPQNIPLDLLGRRPDLAAQRARVNAASSDMEAAQAAFYPNINLVAMAGLQAIGLNQLLSAGSFLNSAGPALRLPIFDGGRLRAAYAGKNADLDGAIAQYNQSVVGAAQDVAEQLARAAALAPEQAASRDALAAAEEAYRLATLRYRAGLSAYLPVLTVEAQLLAQRRAAADIKARQQDVQISLIRALGGGFQDDAQLANAAGRPAR